MNYRIAIASVDGISFVEIGDIVRIQGSGNYSTLYLKDESVVTASKSLKHFESILPIELYFRTHQSHLVNISSIKRIHTKAGYSVELKNGDVIPLVRNKKEKLVKQLLRKRV